MNAKTVTEWSNRSKPVGTRFFVRLSLIGMVVLLSSCSTPKPRLPHVLTPEDVRKITDQDHLIRIIESTRNSDSPDVPLAAIDHLTNQNALAQIALGEFAYPVTALSHCWPVIRKQAVAKLHDQSVLTTIALEKRDSPYVRAAAVGMLEDPAILKRFAYLPIEDLQKKYFPRNPIAIRHDLELIQLAAVERLADEAVLQEIAMEHASTSVRVAALGRITNQVFIAGIALTDSDHHVYKAAVSNLTDQAQLLMIARADPTRFSDKMNSHLRRYIKSLAVRKVQDQAFLASIALQTSDDLIRAAAISGLRDQDLLSQIARQETNSFVRLALAERIHDPELLAEMALNDESEKVRYTAADRITHWRSLVSVACRTRDLRMGRRVFANPLMDEAAITNIALQAQSWEIRDLAVERMTHQVALAKVTDDEDWRVRRHAASRLRDPSLIARVAMQTDDCVVRANALQHLTDAAILAQHGMWLKPEMTVDVANTDSLLEIMLKAKDRGVRLTAFANLPEPALPKAEGDESERFRELCAELLRLRTFLNRQIVLRKYGHCRIVVSCERMANAYCFAELSPMGMRKVADAGLIHGESIVAAIIPSRTKRRFTQQWRTVFPERPSKTGDFIKAKVRMDDLISQVQDTLPR